ncbi:hypothetical protein D3C87_2171160 [compost metagenome]
MGLKAKFSIFMNNGLFNQAVNQVFEVFGTEKSRCPPTKVNFPDDRLAVEHCTV